MLQMSEVGLFGHTWQRLTVFYDYVLYCPKDTPFILYRVSNQNFKSQL